MRRMRLRGIAVIGTVVGLAFGGASIHAIKENFRPDLVGDNKTRGQEISSASETVVVTDTHPQYYVGSYEFNTEVHRVRVYDLKVCGMPRLSYAGENIDIKETLYMNEEVEVLTELSFQDSNFQRWFYVKTKSGTTGWVKADGLS